MNKMTHKKNRVLLINCVIVVFIALCSIGYVGFKFYKHEKNQQAMIQSLQSSLSTQGQKIEKLEQEIFGKGFEWSDDGFNYFAIGNSITKHGLANYWWDDDRGMAASKDETDYVHLVDKYLKANNDNVVTYAYNFSAWEVNYADRAEFLENLDIYLSDKIDLITIQLGENATDLSTWESDFEELIIYVKNKAVNANIIVVGDFWSNENRDSIKQQVAQMCGVTYVSLDEIKDNSNYYAGIGTAVEDEYGEIHFIEHSGVALHPGDKGMEVIATKIVDALGK